MRTSATNRRLRILLTGIRDQKLIPNPDFQRRLVWSNAHKLAFLQTVLSGLPFPEIFTAAGEVDADTGDGPELIVDGQQRITTLYQYFTNSPDLRLGTSIRKYADLTQDEKVAFLEYEVVVRDLGALGEDQTRDIFYRINSTKYSLNAMEVNNSRFDGALKRFAEEMAEGRFFQENPIFTSLDGRRMNDTRFLLTILISLMTGYFNRDDEHELFLEKLNDDFPEQEEIHARLTNVCNLIEAGLFGDRSRIWQKADLLTAFVEIDLFLQQGGSITPGILHDRAEEFYAAVEEVTRVVAPDPEVAQYYRRIRSGSNDRASRAERGDAWRAHVLESK